MNHTDLTDSGLYFIWEQFINTGKLEQADLDVFISESWQRSRQARVDPYRPMGWRRLEPVKMQRCIKASEELIDAAHSVMEEIHDSVRGSGFRVILSDESGNIINAIPYSEAILNTCWNEGEVGTNAIGTAIKTGRSIQICGVEHYSYTLHNTTSSAAPVFDQNGNLITVLALTGPSSEDHSHVLSMLVKAAEKIIDKTIILAKNKQLQKYNERLTDVFNTISDGILIITNTGVIEFLNPAVEKIVGKKAAAVTSTFIQDLFQGNAPLTEKMLYHGTPYSDVEVFVNGSRGRTHCLASGKPSSDENGNINGGIIILQNMERVHSLVNRFCGSHAECSFKSIIGSSQGLQGTIKLARIAAETTSTVLLQGESGTGKEVFAQAIHNASSRRKGPFVAINCGAIPKELVGSELFGYVDGAFTGARRGGRPGKFEIASGGTFFLDEIGDMPLELQVALLRVLQNKRVTRIGDSKEILIDVRFICATNKDLKREIEKGNFREDLFYRLNVISIKIPALRDRRSDIPLLAKHYLDHLGEGINNLDSISDPVIMDHLMDYDWPGNVRELQNVIERLICIAGQRRITAADLPLEISRPEKSLHKQDTVEPSPVLVSDNMQKQSTKALLAEEEVRQIITLLEKHKGNKTQVAKEMGFSRMTLYRKMKLYNIDQCLRAY